MALLPPEQVDQAVAGTQWQRDGDRLVRQSRHGDFASAMAFVNRVAEAAEAANHHPDIAVSWDTVTLTLWTHTEGGITSRDLELSAEIDRLAG